MNLFALLMCMLTLNAYISAAPPTLVSAPRAKKVTRLLPELARTSKNVTNSQNEVVKVRTLIECLTVRKQLLAVYFQMISHMRTVDLNQRIRLMNEFIAKLNRYLQKLEKSPAMMQARPDLVKAALQSLELEELAAKIKHENNITFALNSRTLSLPRPEKQVVTLPRCEKHAGRKLLTPPST